MVLICSWEGR